VDLENLCEGDEGEQQPRPDEIVRHPVGSGLCKRNSKIFEIRNLKRWFLYLSEKNDFDIVF
jgi:hypothetical protein